MEFADDDDLTATQIVRMSNLTDYHVRSEQNLIRIGLWSAGRRSSDGEATKSRSFTVTLRRDGRKVARTITIDGSRGLPTIADLDKWMALLRFFGKEKQKAKDGKLKNPIRCSGYQLLVEAGLTDAGANYEKLYEWGTRLAKTTITSNEVIYLASSRKYADETLGIFQQFKRIATKDNTGNSELYEIWLAQWLLDSINSEYVYLEAYPPYKQLKLPIARCLFGYLHFWFTENGGKEFSKDYFAICDLLDIKKWNRKGKIIQGLGASLNELVEIGYLAKWEVEERMVAEKLFKVIFYPGKEILKNLKSIDVDRSRKRARLPGDSEDAEWRELEDEYLDLDSKLSAEALTALTQMKEFGIGVVEGKRLLETVKPAKVVDMIEYVSALTAEPGSSITNPPGLVISKLRKGDNVPKDFVTTRMTRQRTSANLIANEQRQIEAQLSVEYDQWITRQSEEQLARLYPGPDLDKKLNEIAIYLSKSNKQVARMSSTAKRSVARHQLLKEIKEDLALPAFHEWQKEHPQRELFQIQ